MPYVRTMLVDYAAFQSPQDTMLYVAGTCEARQYWRWAYALPHCNGSDKSETLLFENDEKPGENEADNMRLFWKNIRTILERRRMRLQDKESGADVKLPFMLVVVDAIEPAPDWSCLHDLEGEAAISTILMDGQMLGAGILFLVPDRSKVPSRCLSVIEVDDDPADEDSAVFRYAETGFNSILYVGSTKLVSTQEKAREFSRNLEMVDLRRGYGSSLASTVTLMEMLNVTTLDQLQQMAQENWSRSMDPKVADWLFTAVGLLSGNEPRVLTFSAKADGVHGIIAGSTGSGKSELLMTLIIGMALNFNPNVLNFVLVDYKGGSAFEPFKRLPHKVDIVTNLDQSATAQGVCIDHCRTGPAPEAEHLYQLQGYRALPQEGSQPGPGKASLPAPVHHHRRVRGNDLGQRRIQGAAGKHHPPGPRAGRDPDPGCPASGGRHRPDARQHQVPHLPARGNAG